MKRMHGREGLRHGFSLLLAGVLFLVMIMPSSAIVLEAKWPSAPGNPSSWAQDEVQAARESGLVVSAVLTGSYQSHITRIDFCKLAMRLVSVSTGMTAAQYLAQQGVLVDPATFSDTSAMEVLQANALGIVNGVGGGRFNPEGFITRQEAATILMRTAHALGYRVPNGTSIVFDDRSQFASYAEAAIGFISACSSGANDQRVMGGVGSGRFDPTGPYTREQSILTVLRLFNVVEAFKAHQRAMPAVDGNVAPSPSPAASAPPQQEAGPAVGSDEWLAQQQELVVDYAELPQATITRHPDAAIAFHGSTHTFSVSALPSEEGILRYQWQKKLPENDANTGWTNIVGANESRYVTDTLVFTMEQVQYRCGVSNETATGYSTVYTRPATLFVTYPFPVFQTYPGDMQVLAGMQIYMVTQASLYPDSEPLYSWYRIRNGERTLLGRGRSYTIEVASAEHDGDIYYVQLLDPRDYRFPYVMSPHARMTVTPLRMNYPLPVIEREPLSVSVKSGQTATFSLDARLEEGEISYQWMQFGYDSLIWKPIEGATSSSYTTPPIALRNSGTQYRCIVRNSSDPSHLTVSSLIVRANVIP